MRATEWEHYVQGFHAERPGVTERAFEHSAHPDLGTPYAWLAEGVGAQPGRVLDVACGNAAVLPHLAAHDGYLGVDVSEAELAHARQAGRGPLLRADARRLPLPDDSVDTVVSSMGLMLVRPVDDAVAEMARVLRAGGRLALLLPATWPVRVRDARLGLPLALALRGPGSMPQMLSPRRVRRVLGRAGLRVRSVERARFPFAVRTSADAALAVSALYTPGRTAEQMHAAQQALAERARPGAQLPVPLMRVVALAPNSH